MTNIAIGEAVPTNMTNLLREIIDIENQIDQRGEDDTLDAQLFAKEHELIAGDIESNQDAVELLTFVIRTGGLEPNLLVHMEKIRSWVRRATTPQILLSCSGPVKIVKNEVRA